MSNAKLSVPTKVVPTASAAPPSSAAGIPKPQSGFVIVPDAKDAKSPQKRKLDIMDTKIARTLSVPLKKTSLPSAGRMGDESPSAADSQSADLETDDDPTDPDGCKIVPGNRPPLTPAEQSEFLALARLTNERNGDKEYGLKPKYRIYSVAEVGVSKNPTGTFYGLNNAAIGTGVDQRLGQYVKNHRLNIKGSISWGYTSTAGGSTNPRQLRPEPVTILIFWDRFPIVGVPSLLTTDATNANNDTAAVLHAPGILFPERILSQACYNANTHGYRYEIVHKSIHQPNFAAATLTVGGPNVLASHQEHFDITIDLKGRTTSYYDTLISSQFTNSLVGIWYSDDLSFLDPATVIRPIFLNYQAKWEFFDEQLGAA